MYFLHVSLIVASDFDRIAQLFGAVGERALNFKYVYRPYHYSLKTTTGLPLYAVLPYHALKKIV